MLNQQHLKTLLGFEMCNQKENPFRPMLSADRESLETFLNYKKPCLILDSKAHAPHEFNYIQRQSQAYRNHKKAKRKTHLTSFFSLSRLQLHSSQPESVSKPKTLK